MKLIILLLIITTFSCSSEDVNKSENNNAENYRLFKIKQTFSDDGSVSIAEFNYKDGLLNSVKNTDNGEIHFSYFYYNSNNQIASGTSDYGSETTYTYTGNNITKEFYSEQGGGYELITEYFYNIDNNVESQKQYSNNELISELLFEYDDKNNLIKITDLNSGYIGTQTFDNMKNPYKTSYTKELRVINQLNGENNVLESYQVETFVYEYNDKGYPIKQTIYESGNLESVVEFEYK
ncbi:hypothetical protein ACS386_13630 [Flavobacteriaceae bacterium LMO-SS05]